MFRYFKIEWLGMWQPTEVNCTERRVKWEARGQSGHKFDDKNVRGKKNAVRRPRGQYVGWPNAWENLDKARAGVPTIRPGLHYRSWNPNSLIILENTHYIFVVKTVRKYEVTQSKQTTI